MDVVPDPSQQQATVASQQEPLGKILVNPAQNLCVAARAVTPLQSCNKSAANPSQRLSGHLAMVPPRSGFTGPEMEAGLP
jgi:hypothetical protein